MVEVLNTLVKIQMLDSEMARTHEEINAVPQKIATLEQDIEKARKVLQEKKDRVQDISKEYKMMEGDLAANETKIEKLNSQTFAVKTNEEYRAILHEVEFLKKENKRIEDEMISILEEEEKLKGILDALEKQTKEDVDERQKKIDALNKNKEKLLGTMQKMQSEFENHFNKLPEDARELYSKIKKVRGKAVCLIEDETCSGCFASLTPQFMNELKKQEEILLCGHCGRILIFMSADKTE